MKHRWGGCRLSALLICVACPPLASAQPGDPLDILAYPTAAIRILVPWPPNGAADQLARFVSSRLEASIKQRVIVENRPGRAAIAGTEAASKARPDGHVLLIGASDTHVINPILYGSGLTYRGIEDFEPVALLAHAPMALAVRPVLPARSTAELVALARSGPAPLRMATTGPGSRGHLLTALLRERTGIEFIEIPIAGSAGAVNAVASGDADAVFASYASMATLVNTGKLRLIAVASRLPDRGAPALGEMLADYQLDLYYGMFAPKGTPREIVDRLNLHLGKILEKSEARRYLTARGLEPDVGTPADFGRRLQADALRWRIALDGVKVTAE